MTLLILVINPLMMALALLKLFYLTIRDDLLKYLSTALSFTFRILFRLSGIVFDQTVLENHNTAIYEDYNKMIEYIWARYGNRST